MSFTFEGETKDLSARHKEYITKILNDRGFKNEKVTIEPVGKAGDNFVANVKRIIVNNKEKPFKMIAKIAPINEMVRKNMNSSIMFLNENVMYMKILPKLTQLEKEAGIPENERLRYAVCYGTLMEEPNEIILLEDLCVTNFIMFNKFESLSSESVKLVLRSFAILHSLSYALKHQDPETFEEYSKQLISLWDLMAQMEQMSFYFAQLEGEVLSMLDNEKYKKVVKGLLTGMLSNATKNSKFYRGNKCSVIQQGDAWTNNIMFKLNGDKVVECCMIDYQLSNQNSPVADLHYMIFNCTDYETRYQHYNEWIDYYYAELDKRLANFGLRVNDLYSRERLDADLRRHAKQSIGQAIMGATMLMREHHEAANFKSAFEKDMTENLEEILEVSKLDTMETTSMDRFRNKLEGLINSFIELGLL